MLTYFVTFPERGNSGVHVSLAGVENNKQCFKVEIPQIDGEASLSTSLRAISVARPRHEAYLKLLFAQKAQSSVKPRSAPTPIEPTLVFEPDEIEPFIGQALVRMVAVAERPIRLNLQGHGTASTDCVNNVTLNPDPFLRGEIEDGFGRCLHEAGHIREDAKGSKKDRPRRSNELPIGIELLNRAYKEGGEALQNILNLVMDRRTDDLQCRRFPGNASAIRRRLGRLFPGEKRVDGKVVQKPNGRSLDCATSVFTDFAYACKKRTRPRHAVVRRCVSLVFRAIKRVNKGQRKYTELLSVSKQVLALLNEHATEQDREQQAFSEFMKKLFKAIYGSKADASMQRLFRQMMAKRLTAQRRQSYSKISQIVKSISTNVQHSGPSAVGTPGGDSPTVPGAPGGEGPGEKVIEVGSNAAAYGPVSMAVRAQSTRLSDIIRKLSVPESVVLRGLDKGEIDMEALPMLVAGHPDCMKRDLQTFKLDLALAILADLSMSTDELPITRIATTFNDALSPHGRGVSSALYGFNDDVFSCGPASRNNGIAGLKSTGGTNEHFATRIAGNWLRAQRRSRKILLTICDGGPSSPQKVRKEVDELVRRGVIPIRILVGVDVAPKTHPIDLLFDNWEEFSRELEQLFSTIISATRV